MTEQEFWASTYAMVAVLYHIKELEWGERRDFFAAQLIAIQVSSKEKSYSAEEILELRYPKMHESVTVTVDPDLGAAGNWKALRASLKGQHVSSL